MGPAIEASGGCAGNTAAGIASFGARSAFFGKVSNDHLGKIYAHDIRAQGVAFDTRPLEGEPPTARSMIFVTPDGERSMNTYLGACVELGPEDVERDKAEKAKLVYFEGYLWDPPRAKDAIRLTAQYAHAAGGEVSMSLSDSFCVDRYRDEFLELMRSGTVDIVFANESELKSLYQTSSFEAGLEQIGKDCKLAAVTRSELGSVIVRGGEIIPIEAIAIDELVDTTGAGDLYAAGFLYGYVTGRSLADCGPPRLACRWNRDPADRPAPAEELAPGCRAVGTAGAGRGLKQFREKWKPVLRPELRRNKRSEPFDDSFETMNGSRLRECPRAAAPAGSCSAGRSSRSAARRPAPGRRWRRRRSPPASVRPRPKTAR